MFVFMRKIRRISAWTDQWADGTLALSEVFDTWVQKGGRLTVWKCSNAVDEDAIVAIAAGITSARERQVHFRVSPDWLTRHGHTPVHSPDRTPPSHSRAAELHHDICGLNESSCRLLCAHLRADFDTIHVHFPKSEVRSRVRRQLPNFLDQAVKSRLEAEVAL